MAKGESATRDTVRVLVGPLVPSWTETEAADTHHAGRCLSRMWETRTYGSEGAGKIARFSRPPDTGNQHLQATWYAPQNLANAAHG